METRSYSAALTNPSQCSMKSQHNLYVLTIFSIIFFLVYTPGQRYRAPMARREESLMPRLSCLLIQDTPLTSSHVDHAAVHIHYPLLFLSFSRALGCCSRFNISSYSSVLQEQRLHPIKGYGIPKQEGIVLEETRLSPLGHLLRQIVDIHLQHFVA